MAKRAIIFAGSSLLFFAAGAWVIRARLENRIHTGIQAVKTVRGYQGLILDTGGLGSMVLGVIEQKEEGAVRSFELMRGHVIVLSRDFPSPFIPKRIDDLRVLQTSMPMDEYNVRVALAASNESCLILFLLSLLFGTGVVATISSAAKNRVRELALARAETTRSLSKQIAHDIQSPLSALNSVMERDEIDPEGRALVRSAIKRIRSIAEGLLSPERVHAETRSRHEIGGLVMSLLKEKRAEFLSRNDISFQYESSEESSVYALISPKEFLRVISNLVNNAVASMSSGGLIRIALHATAARIDIRIIDTGHGISPINIRNLERIKLDETATSGFGLVHARKTVLDWGGELTISSQAGKGTTVRISLPSL